MKRVVNILLILTGILIFSSELFAQEDDYPPGTIKMTPKVELNLQPVPLEVPEKFKGLIPENMTLNLPPGFKVKVFAASGLRGARLMKVRKDGVLFVANMKAGNASEFVPGNSDTGQSQIVALPDWDNDGVADTVIIAADQLRWANSLAFYKGDMYVADTHQIIKFTDADGDMVYEQREVFADNIPTADSPHITRTIAINEEEDLIYLSVGSSCDVCRESDPERATVLAFNADGTGRRVFATGLRNAIGLDIHPQTGDLWATNNGHTERDSTMPPEWIDIVRDGGFYGWPLAFGYQSYIDFDYRGHWRVPPITSEDSALVESMQRPAALVDAHSSPMGIHFYPEGNFPAEYKNAAFVAYRAGFRGPDPGHKVVALFVNPDGSDAEVGDFITGFWPDPPNQDNIWAKPVGVASDTIGNLYISSDWINHFVLRVEYEDEQTGVKNEMESEVPAKTTLYQNYPNPFNPLTVISYQLTVNSEVSLRIYDITGKLVKTLVNGRQNAGQYSVKFNAENLPSGVYLYKLEADGYSQTRKMILLK